MTLSLSHFAAVLVFATCASVVFGITQRTTTRAMVRYGVACWLGFGLVVICAGWLMHLVRH